MDTSFGATIRQMRSQQGLSVKTLAGRIGISAQYLSDIERGNRNPPDNNLIGNMARELDADMDYLIFKAGRLPEWVSTNQPPEVVAEAFAIFKGV